MARLVVLLVTHQCNVALEFCGKHFEQRGLFNQVSLEIAEKARIIAVLAQPMSDRFG